MFATKQVPIHGIDGLKGWALIDGTDLPICSGRRWNLNPWGYATSSKKHEDGRWAPVLMHREILGLGKGDPEVDHINGNRLDNRRSNLRLVTKSAQQQNLYRGKGGRSRYRGVSLKTDGRKKCWRATAMLNRKQHFIGSFYTEEEAAEAAATFRAKHMPYSPEARQTFTDAGSGVCS